MMRKILVIPLIAMLMTGCASLSKKTDEGQETKANPIDVVKSVAIDKGLDIVAARYVAQDIDAEEEIAAACRAGGRVYVCLFDQEKNGAYVLVRKSDSIRGDDVRGVAGLRLDDRAGFLLEVLSNTPDGVAHEILGYDLSDMRIVLEETIFRDGETDDISSSSTLVLGDDSGLWRVGEDGTEVWVRVGEQSMSVTSNTGDFDVVTGVYHKVFQFNGSTYRVSTERAFHPFLSQLQIGEVQATSALNTVSEEPVVLDGDAPMKDFQEAQAAFDGDLSTGWLEGASGLGTGESVQVKFDGATPISMLRIVPGCVDTEMIYERYARPIELQIDFGNGMAFVDFSSPEDASGEIKGIKKLPLSGRGHGAQYLVFLKAPITTDLVKLSIGQARSGESDHTCLSEVAFY